MNSNETNQPLISVIVPVYNIIPYLPRCVESLQKQTYPELEILLIDDGSTDDTPATGWRKMTRVSASSTRRTEVPPPRGTSD